MRVSRNQCQDGSERGATFYKLSTQSTEHEASRTRRSASATSQGEKAEMYYHVGEWSRVIVRDYRHHPLVSIFTSALMIPLSLSTTCTPSRPRAGLSTSTGLLLHPLHLIALLSWSPFFHALLNIPI